MEQRYCLVGKGAETGALAEIGGGEIFLTDGYQQSEI